MSEAEFFRQVRIELFDGVLLQPQVEGLTMLLDAWEHFDPRWKAYGLATAYHETGRAMQPVKENGGRPYGHPPAAYWHAVGPYGKVYYGMGYVQLTWLKNYMRADKELPGFDLVAHPDNALKPEVAAVIMVRGMTEGWFTGYKLGDFLNARVTDWLGARRIINGTDCAARIAGYAVKFHNALKESGK